jgi:hypothetical protein
MKEQKSGDIGDIAVECPCCGARLTIDPRLRKVLSHDAPPPKRSGLDLDQAAALLKEQAARREAIFRQSSEDIKSHSQLLDRKFEAALEKSKDEPVTRPTRDFDLD